MPQLSLPVARLHDLPISFVIYTVKAETAGVAVVRLVLTFSLHVGKVVRLLRGADCIGQCKKARNISMVATYSSRDAVLTGLSGG